MSFRVLLLATLLPCALHAQGDAGYVVLATTTSVRDAGLLDQVLPPFTEISGYQVRTIAVGSGHAMELGRRGEADILILHDPAGEERFVAEGYGFDRSALMHNYFVLAGPPSDPAGIRGAGDVVAAFRGIARAGARFLSRGDQSGTHVKELALWRAAGLEPDREWHWESGQGMSATIQIAAELGAYVLSDIGTFLRHPSSAHLEVMVAADSLLHNPYHVVLARTGDTGRRNPEGARALWEYLLSEPTQEAIAAFGIAEFGQSLFVPDALPASVP